MTEFKVISGGQTGVDRAALDAAMEMGCDVGGWCPEGRKAEDGVISSKYPLQELPGAGYKERTRQNVLDSDGTLIIFKQSVSGGTKKTVNYCQHFSKPFLLLDTHDITIQQATEALQEFVLSNLIHVLNVAGPRASQSPELYGFTFELLKNFLLLNSAKSDNE